MYEFDLYPAELHHEYDKIRVWDDENNPHAILDDHLGCAARELLNTAHMDGLGIKPHWMAHEVAYRAWAMEPDVDPVYDFEIRQNDGEGATIIVLNDRGRK